MISVRIGSAVDVDAMGWAKSRSQVEQWRLAADSPDALLLVAHQASKILGKAVLSLSARPNAAWLWLVSVDPAHRCRGVGSALIHYAEAEALARGFHMIELAVDEVNSRARAFYERLGYETVEPFVDHVRYVDDDGTEVAYEEPGWLLQRIRTGQLSAATLSRRVAIALPYR